MLTCVFSSLSFADYREKPPTEKFTKFSTSTLQFYINRKKPPRNPESRLHINLSYCTVISINSVTMHAELGSASAFSVNNNYEMWIPPPTLKIKSKQKTNIKLHVFDLRVTFRVR